MPTRVTRKPSPRQRRRESAFPCGKHEWASGVSRAIPFSILECGHCVLAQRIGLPQLSSRRLAAVLKGTTLAAASRHRNRRGSKLPPKKSGGKPPHSKVASHRTPKEQAPALQNRHQPGTE